MSFLQNKPTRQVPGTAGAYVLQRLGPAKAGVVVLYKADGTRLGRVQKVVAKIGSPAGWVIATTLGGARGRWSSLAEACRDLDI